MNSKFVTRAAMLFTLLMILSTAACGGIAKSAKEVVGENTAQYDKGVALVQGYQVAAADYFLKVNSCYAKMDRMEKTTTSYYEAVSANTESWTGNFREEKAALAEQLAAYNADSTGTVADPTKLDLDKMSKDGTLPSDLSAGLNLYFNAVTQAPPPVVDSAITGKLMDAQSECYDSINYVGTNANDKAGQYNTWRRQVTGEIISKVSEMVGFPLPESLPMITGGTAVDSQLK